MSAASPRGEPDARRIPLTVVGGFLGAGKTTLVNALLAEAQGRRVAILVNDFGVLSIDAALISTRSARTITLANGCVCCTLVNGLAQALLEVLRMDPPPDHVLVEASGVGDPRRIAQIGRAGRTFGQDMTLVMAAADQVETLACDGHVGDTVLRQLAGADLIVLNKVDLVDSAAAERTAGWLGEVAPQAPVVSAKNAQVPCDVVLGPVASDAGSGASRRLGEALYAHRGGDHTDTFATRAFRCKRPVSEAALRAALDALPGAVLRAKGFVRFATSPDVLQLIQVVGRRWSIAPAPADAVVAESMLVVIGAARALQHADLGDVARVFANGGLSD